MKNSGTRNSMTRFVEEYLNKQEIGRYFIKEKRDNRGRGKKQHRETWPPRS
jgi:hypothetical protein